MFLDPRLVELYDEDNPDGPDHDHVRALADRLDARTVVDLGCGTGLLTVSLARPGRRVIGVDPDPGMLDHARRRPGGAAVEWRLGDSRAIGEVAADLAVMTGNVAQHILGADWPRTLANLAAALRPGAGLVFESRRPEAQGWTRWTRSATLGRRDSGSGPLVEWLEVEEVTDDGQVTFAAHTVFEASGEHLEQRTTLAFRDQDRLTADLDAAGFVVSTVTGSWEGQPVGPDSALLVVEATRSAGAGDALASRPTSRPAGPAAGRG